MVARIPHASHGPIAQQSHGIRAYTQEAPEIRIPLLHSRHPSERVAMKTNHPRAREIPLPVKPEEVAVLRFALDHALSSISEAHAEDRAQLRALIERLEGAEKKGARR